MWLKHKEFEPHLAGAQLLAGSMFQHHYRLRGMLNAAFPNLVRIYHIDRLMRPTSILQGVEQEARRLYERVRAYWQLTACHHGPNRDGADDGATFLCQDTHCGDGVAKEAEVSASSTSHWQQRHLRRSGSSVICRRAPFAIIVNKNYIHYVIAQRVKLSLCCPAVCFRPIRRSG
jgi:hypothetical protein